MCIQNHVGYVHVYMYTHMHTYIFACHLCADLTPGREMQTLLSGCLPGDVLSDVIGGFSLGWVEGGGFIERDRSCAVGFGRLSFYQ